MIEVNLGWCGKGLVLDWVYLCDFLSNFHKNWSGGNSLVVRDCCVLSSCGCGVVIAFKTAVFDRDEFWERCVGMLTLDWLYLCKFWSAGNSLVIKNRLVLFVDGGSAAITSERAMFNRGEFWEVWGMARAWLGVSLQVLRQFPQELECWQ